MPALPIPRHEAFALARAEGLTLMEAYLRADYKGNGARAYVLSHRDDVNERIAELTALALWGVSPSLGPVIDELMMAARTAAKLGTAPGFNAARGLWAEAAKLKIQLGRQSPNPLDAYEDIPPRMSQEEWMATYAAAG